MKSLLLISSLFLLTLTINVPPHFEIRQKLPYNLAFSKTSLITTVVLTCSRTEISKHQKSQSSLRNTILSFFYYNTYPIRQMVIVDQCSVNEESQSFLRSLLPEENESHRQEIRIVQSKQGFINALSKGFAEVQTKYVYLLLEKWITYDGPGLLEQSVDVLEYCQKNDIKVSQITQLYPVWGEYRFLGPLHKTDHGTKFHEIKTFKPKQKYYLTFNPSVFNFQYIYDGVLGKDPLAFANLNNCQEDRECFQKFLGTELYQKRGYKQYYINTGTSQPNVYRLSV